MYREIDQAFVGLNADPNELAGGVRGGPMLFLGPSGTGKTETAKALAKGLYGSADAIIFISMESYSQPHSAERLFGAPPGYVAHEEGSVLVNALLRNPHQMIVLDEVEKAHPDVLKTLLGLLDQGTITDGRGQTARLSDAVVIATSNLGAAQVTKGVANGQIEDTPEGIERAFLATAERLVSESRVQFTDGEVVSGFGRPELWYRLARRPVVFDRLRLPVLGQLVEKQLEIVRRRLLTGEGVTLQLSAEALTSVVAPRIQELGALNGRLLDGAVRDVLSAPLASEILTAGTPPSRVVATVRGGALDFRLLP